ncbi:MAG: hypothetical protein M0Z85_03595 [Gammaproteobacteria bacterium]|nr:hypothetical protein [Gammaproteobacteria bacterium]
MTLSNAQVLSQIPQAYQRTAAEIAAGVTPTNYGYPELWVERYGADPTGTTDSGVAFRNACLVARQKGGGIIRAYGSLYLFNTWDTTSFYSTNNLALFILPANTELAGGGQFFTRLRISQTARTGMYNGGANRTHIIGMPSAAGGQYVHDLEFDYDGIVQAASNDYCYFARTNSGQCIFERLYGVQAPITNAIADSSEDTANGNSPLGPTIVRGCWFQDCGPNMTGNSALNQDCSYLYLNAPGSRAEKNRIFNTAIANHNCGGIEMHSAQYYVTENYIKNCWPGMYLGVEDGVTISVGSVVDKNYVGYCNAGIFLVDRHEGLKIINNYLEANCDSAGAGFGYSFTDFSTPLNSTDGSASAGVQTALLFANNTIDSTYFLQGTARASSGSVGANAYININLGCLQGAIIRGNTIVSPAPGAITLSGSTTAPMQDVLVEDNVLTECQDTTLSYSTAFFQVLATSETGWTTSPVMQDIMISGNRLSRGASLSLTAAYAGLVTSGGAGALGSLENVFFDDLNVSSNVLGTVGFTDIQATDVVAVNGLSYQSQSITANGTAIVISHPLITAARVAPTAAYTGITMPKGTVDGQKISIINSQPSANSLTMAPYATSNVADGTSCVVSGYSSMTFTWSAATGAWYHD